MRTVLAKVRGFVKRTFAGGMVSIVVERIEDG
jgi:hypothetical protein